MTSSSTPAKWFISALCCAATGVGATEYAPVVSSTPVLASVPVAQRQCYDEPVAYPQRSSGGGALLGAVIGAAVGNSVGIGAGRAAATGIGMIAGAAIGDRVEAEGSPPVATTAQRCRNVTRYEQRTVGYDVVYDYQGARRSVRMANDPGPQVALEVNVTPVGAQAPSRRDVMPPTPVYLSPADLPYDDEEVPPPRSRVIYATQPAIYVNPWPYVVIGGGRGWYGGPAYRGWHGHGHRR